MDFSHGYTASFYITLLDAVTWTEDDKMDIISGSIRKQNTDIRQSAALTAPGYDAETERWIRIYMDARQNENVSHNAIFTGLATSPKYSINGNTTTREVECYSVLKPLADIKFPRGWYIAAGTNIYSACRQLMRYTPAPYEVADGGPALSTYIISDDGDSALTMLDRVLNAIGWTLRITGSGLVRFAPPSTQPVAEFGAKAADIIEKTLSVERDYFSAPNVLRATAGDAVATARDENPASPLSIPTRGREVIMSEDDVALGLNEGIAEYATRRLREEHQVAEKVSYTRRYVPEIDIGDIVEFNYNQIKGTYKVTSQTINLTYGGKTAEEAERL